MTIAFDVEITEGAVADLRAIHHYIAVNSAIETADRFLDKLSSQALALERFPRRGSVPDEIAHIKGSELRQIVVSPYRLIYEVAGQRVIVHLVAHGRQNLRDLLRRRLLLIAETS